MITYTYAVTILYHLHTVIDYYQSFSTIAILITVMQTLLCVPQDTEWHRDIMASSYASL